MSDELVFEGYGRDLQAEFDSVGDSSFANAAKDLVAWFSGDGFSDGLWRVNASKSEAGASLAFMLVEADAYVAPVFPQAVETTPEQTVSQADAGASVEVANPDAGGEPVSIAASAEVAAAEAVADTPVAASSDGSSGPQNTSSTERTV